nr:MAG TPA: hypothetical protein [Caudoviricetes sp.]
MPENIRRIRNEYHKKKNRGNKLGLHQSPGEIRRPECR